MKREQIPGGPRDISVEIKKLRETARSPRDTTQQIVLSSKVQEMMRAEKKGKKAALVVLAGDDVGRVVSIGEDVGKTIIIGRSSECDFVLRDDGLSRRHAEVIQVGAGRILIRDLGSTNGIFHKGKKVEEAIIADGEKILLGKHIILRYAYQDTLDENYLNEMYETATRDGLTNAFNRKHFFQRMKTDLSFTRRHRIPLTLLILDIDHFKKVNDTYGHQTGDEVLVQVTSGIMNAIRTEDMLARYGGEEFAILAPGTDFGGAKVLGERIRELVSEIDVPIVGRGGETVSVTISIGSATVSSKAIVSSEQVVSVADECLYSAKNGGRNKVTCSELA